MKLKSQKEGFKLYYRNQSHLGCGCHFQTNLRIKLSVNGTEKRWLNAFCKLALILQDLFFQAQGYLFGRNNAY